MPPGAITGAASNRMIDIGVRPTQLRCADFSLKDSAPGSGQTNYLKPLEISEKYAAIYLYIALFRGKKSIIPVINVDGLVKSRKSSFFVIPAKAGIQSRLWRDQ